MERFQPIGHAILNRSGIIQVKDLLYLTMYFKELNRKSNNTFFLLKINIDRTIILL